MSTDVVLGVDVGGTFTDVVLRRAGTAPVLAKVLTTPADPSVGVRRGIAEVLTSAGVDPSSVTRVVHGTTLATNVILEERGARLVLVTTDGFGDLLRLGRSARVEDDRYDLRFAEHRSPIAPDAIVEAAERTTATGAVVRGLTDEAITDVVDEVRRRSPEAVAVSLLHSWANPAHERALADALTRALPDVHVAASIDISPEMREYDRAMTTVVSASVGPLMSSYLGRLTGALRADGLGADVWVMDSAGGVISVELAARRPVLTIESGGAAGMRAGAEVARSLADGEAISFDMGGTTAKVGIVRGGEPDITHQFQLGGKGSFGVARAGTGIPVRGAVVDLAEVGAGGGSIAWIDAGGSLRVGPRSSGASPGPAAYGLGGSAPTVTDANVVLGVLEPGPLSGGVSLDVDAAADAIERDVAKPLGLDVLDAAVAIRDIAVAHMAGAMRVVTVQRGVDPRGLPIVAFGGAGPMHGVALAETFGIDQVLVPRAAGVASARGLATASPSADRVRTRPLPATADNVAEALRVLAELAVAASAELDGPVELRSSIDMRYRGQAHDLTVDAGGVTDLATLIARFRERYHQLYGVDLDAPAELVTYRVRASLVLPSMGAELIETVHASPSAHGTRPVHFGTAHGLHDAALWHWDALAGNGAVPGPAIVTGEGTTVVVPPTWTVTVVDGGHLDIRR